MASALGSGLQNAGLNRVGLHTGTMVTEGVRREGHPLRGPIIGVELCISERTTHGNTEYQEQAASEWLGH